MEKIAGFIVKKLNAINPMTTDELEVCKFGVYHDLYMVLNVLTSLVIGVLMHMIPETVALNVAYIAVRVHAGGHHAPNPIRCYINSTVLLIVDLLLIRYIRISWVLLAILFLIALVVIWFMAPVESQNRPLDAEEIQVFKKRTRMVLVIEAVIFLCSLVIRIDFMSTTIFVAVMTEMFMLIAGVVSLKVHKS